MKIKAIYLQDFTYNKFLPFEYNKESGFFELIEDNEISYPASTVIRDNDFVLYTEEFLNGSLVARQLPSETFSFLLDYNGTAKSWDQNRFNEMIEVITGGK